MPNNGLPLILGANYNSSEPNSKTGLSRAYLTQKCGAKNIRFSNSAL
jgi:hypothetical protein